MAEDKISVGGILEKLALITDGCQNLFPKGNVIMVFELEGGLMIRKTLLKK
jgi:hypothetical protein